MNIIDVAKKIGSLHQALQQQGNSVEESAAIINDVLLFGEKVPSNIVKAAWDFYAQEMGVKV